MTIRSRFAVLGEPSFRPLFLGRTTSLIGDGIAPVALAFAVLDLTGSATDLGLVLAAHSLVTIALVLVGGVYADRLSPRLAMLGADLVRVVSTGAIAALLLAGVAEIWQLALLYAIDGAATAFFNPAADALVPQVVPAARLQDANALLNFSRSAGRFAGPALAGIVLALGSPGTALAVDAATFAVSAACLFRVRAPRRASVSEGSFVADLRHGWSEFSARTWLWSIVLGAAVINAIFFPAFQVLGPTVARAELGGSSAWALIAAAFGVGAMAGGVIALSLRPRHPLLLSESLVVLFALPIALLAGPSPLALVALGAFIAGLVTCIASIFYETMAAQHIPAESLSRVYAYDWFGSLALEPLGLVLIGPLALGLGTSPTLWGAAALMVLCQIAVILVPSVRRLEYRPGPDGEEPPTPLLRPLEPGD
jgi:MFS family permease